MLDVVVVWLSFGICTQCSISPSIESRCYLCVHQLAPWRRRGRTHKAKVNPGHTVICVWPWCSSPRVVDKPTALGQASVAYKLPQPPFLRLPQVLFYLPTRKEGQTHEYPRHRLQWATIKPMLTDSYLDTLTTSPR